MKQCCQNNIPQFRGRTIFCKDCGTKFETNSIKKLYKPKDFQIEPFYSVWCEQYYKVEVSQITLTDYSIIVSSVYESVILENSRNPKDRMWTKVVYNPKTVNPKKEFYVTANKTAEDFKAEILRALKLYMTIITEEEYNEKKKTANKIIEFINTLVPIGTDTGGM